MESVFVVGEHVQFANFGCSDDRETQYEKWDDGVISGEEDHLNGVLMYAILDSEQNTVYRHRFYIRYKPNEVRDG